MNKLVEKIGIDKILHFLVGAVIAFFVDVVMILQDGIFGGWENVAFTFTGVIIAIVAAIIKEFIVDSKHDKIDIIATILGALVPVIAVIIGTLFFIVFN